MEYYLEGWYKELEERCKRGESLSEDDVQRLIVLRRQYAVAYPKRPESKPILAVMGILPDDLEDFPVH